MAGHSLGRIDDTLLVREAQRGNRAAFEELVRHYDQAVLRLAMHLTGSEHEAQDIYQDAFLKAYKSVGNFRFECSFYTWIYRIVTNLCLDHLRKKQVRKEDAPVAVDAQGEAYDVLAQVPDGRSGANPERDLMRRELGTRINHALDKLTPRERMVFELKHYQGLKLRTVGRDFEYHRRNGEEHFIPGHAEVARLSGGHAMKRVCGGTGVSPVRPPAGRQASGQKQVKGVGQECPTHTPPLKG